MTGRNLRNYHAVMTTSIYGLFSSRDKTIRYVGKTTSLKRRLEEHLKSSEDDARGKWIRAEVAAGYSIELVVIIENASTAFDEQRLLDVFSAPRGHTHNQLHNDLGLSVTIPPRTAGQQPNRGGSDRQLIHDIAGANGISHREAIRLRRGMTDT